MTTKILLIVTLLFTSQMTQAHGENELGPNGGYIRMPGAFHTEVVPQGKNQIKVYLLDINWKNPSVHESSLKVTLHNGKSVEDLKCTIEANFYLCKLDQKINLKQGQLVVEAKRENQSGVAVTYSLPLRIEDAQHSSH